ncbi:MAG: hypothetical protein P9L94_06165 [Candidatus Hinthialibacter antarcticus]|nr:hypothetical protein [Candidatus Hinthialibacter antarcticus]
MMRKFSVLGTVAVACLIAASTSWSQVGIFDAAVDVDGGNLGAAGSTEYDPALDRYTVNGSGHDIWDAADDFQFVYTEWSGDFVLEADTGVSGGLPTQGWIKSVLMARQDLSPGSANAATRLRRDGQYSIQWRDVADDTDSKGGTDAALRVTIPNPSRQRLTRLGDTFICSYLSADGEWVEVDRHDLVLTDPILVGLGVTAHDNGQIATGTFTGVDLGAPVDGTSFAARDIALPDRLGAEGSSNFADGVFTITGSGWDVWEADDAFQFAYTRVRGDFTLIADVSIDGGLASQAWIKSMLMARQNLTPGSRNVTTRVRRDGQYSMQWRTIQADTDSKGSTAGDARPVGLNPSKQRLDRVGNTFICSYMDEAGAWVEVDRHDVVLFDPIMVGLGVCAHDIGEIATGTFSNIELTSTGKSGAANWELFN